MSTAKKSKYKLDWEKAKKPHNGMGSKVKIGIGLGAFLKGFLFP